MNDSRSLPFRSPLLINVDDSAVVIVDVQEKLIPVMDQSEALVERLKCLVKAAKLLGVSLFYTRQYPQGLGDTIDSIRGEAENTFDKRMFSLRECTAIFETLKNQGVRNIVIAGVEAHICVLQSAFDCVACGFNVFVVADAVGARTADDREIALRRLESSGVTLTTVEAATFEWCETADHDHFKAISALLK